MVTEKEKVFNIMMKKVSDLVEEDLKLKGVYYEREDTIFNVESKNISELVKSQCRANDILVNSGDITKDMIVDMLSNKES